MFENRINGFAPNVGAAAFHAGCLSSRRAKRSSAADRRWRFRSPTSTRPRCNAAIEEHEIDKLFNPDFYDLPDLIRSPVA